MNTTTRQPCCRSWGFWLAWVLGALLLSGISFGYYVVSRALQAEVNLLNAISAFRLVEHFIAEHHRWPNSWDELKNSPAEGEGGEGWPDHFAEIQRYVQIDFQADPREIATQNPRNFSAIKTTGPSYIYGRELASLQMSIRKSIPGAVDK